MQRFTKKDFERLFLDDDACLEWLKNYLYPNGIFCGACNRVTKHHRVTTRRSYSCDVCGHHVHPTANTIYHKSTTPLRDWFYAVFLMASTRCGISAKQLERELGVTYKTAWRMFNKIRSMLTDGGTALFGQVEVDETYVGGKDINRHERKRSHIRGRGAGGKTPVVGMAQRKGRIVARVVPDVRASTLVPIVRAHILPTFATTTVFTDELHSYDRLSESGYNHERIQHSAKVYVSGNVHTNTIEGFWSLVKRGINGAYHAVSPKYLQAYCDEYTFRYNHRDDAQAMFSTMLKQVSISDAG
ncbi:IS1595 family transposase [Chloroflexota bacterium]